MCQTPFQVIYIYANKRVMLIRLGDFPDDHPGINGGNTCLCSAFDRRAPVGWAVPPYGQESMVSTGLEERGSLCSAID